MEEREELCIALIMLNEAEVPSTQYDIFVLAHYAVYRYVATLTNKQREALMFIRMLPKGMYVKGVGAWGKLAADSDPVYIIDC